MRYLLMAAILFFAADAFASGVDCIVKGKGAKGRERFVVTADTPSAAFDKVEKAVRDKGLARARAHCSSTGYNFEISIRKR